MKNILLATLLLCLTSVGVAFAQNVTVSGTVTEESGFALPGVAIKEAGTTNGTVSNGEGKFQLTVGPNAVLEVSSVGYKMQQIRVGNRTTINVVLLEDVTVLSEVVVTGYGEQEKREVTGAISQIKGSTIENLPVQSVDRALQGQAAGVLVQSNNGIPGGAVNVRIRGNGSINAGNNPLYIVDGVQMNTADNAAFTQSNPLAFLNPNEIESIEILKDAAAASIYGAQAANGVILITTKRGKAGRSQIEFSAFTGSSNIMKQLDVLDSYEWYQLRTEAYFNQGTRTPENARANALSNMGELPADWASLTAEQLDAYARELPTYDWQKEAFRTGIIQNYELSLSGGDQKTNFRIAGSYNRQDAIISPVNFERGTLNVSFGHKASERLTLDTKLNLSTFGQNVPFATSGAFLGNPAFSSSTVLPNNPIYNEDGSFNENIKGVLNQNVIQVLTLNEGISRTNQVVGNTSATYQITDNLTFKSLVGLDYRLVQGYNYRDPRTPDGLGVAGRASQQSDWNVNFITTQTLNYAKQFNSVHNLNVIGGLEYRSESREGFSGSGTGFPTSQFRTIQSAAIAESITGFWTGYRRIGSFARVTYDYDKKYLVTLTGRYDGSSRFGSDNRFGFFPAVSAGWYLKEEGFLKNNTTISELKIRGSFGQTGNDQIGNFDARGLYQGAGNYNGSAGIRPTGLANTLLAWERNQTINIGVDYGLFNNRVSGTFEVFERTSKDLILSQPLVWTSGYGGISSNVGELVNRGFEAELRTVNVNRNGFRWITSFNFTAIENEVTELYGGLDELPGSPSIRVGESLGTYFTNKYAGVNPATGRPMWYDLEGNITYQNLAADRQVLGNTQPNYFGGLTNTVTYKGFEFTAFFNYEYGRLVSDGQYGFLRENASRLALNSLRETADARWQNPGDLTYIPRTILTGTEIRSSGPQAGNAAILKSDYIRLKQVTLAYTLPAAMAQNIGLQRARVYVQGVNLWTYTDFPGYDPEFFGASTGILPQTRNFTVGIQVGL